MRFIPVNCVRQGSYLAKTLFDCDGRVLLKKGVQLTDSLLKRVKNNGIFSIYINDDYSDNEIEDIIRPELRQKAVSTVKVAFSNFNQYNKYLSSNMTSSKEKKLLNERETYLKSIGDISRSVIDEMLSHKEIMINLVDIKSVDSYTYQHTVNVAVLSMVLGIELHLNRYELYDLCVGAMLHDLGKVLIPETLLNKPSKLTAEEFDIVKTHTTKGYNYLKNSLDISAPARIIVLQHHEKFNSQGYPRNLKGKEINKLARIVAIADVYDALTSDRPYREALSPNEALELIMANGNNHFDYEMVKVFASKVVAYPVGSLVKLSNGEIAVVRENHPNFPLRPTVSVISNTDNKGATIDLLKNIQIVIKGVHYVAI